MQIGGPRCVGEELLIKAQCPLVVAEADARGGVGRPVDPAPRIELAYSFSSSVTGLHVLVPGRSSAMA